MSLHHMYLEKTTPRVLKVIKLILKPWSQEIIPPAIPNVNLPTARGQGLRVTMWKG